MLNCNLEVSTAVEWQRQTCVLLAKRFLAVVNCNNAVSTCLFVLSTPPVRTNARARPGGYLALGHDYFWYNFDCRHSTGGWEAFYPNDRNKHKQKSNHNFNFPSNTNKLV
jgi:hypothetical protein